MPSRSERRRQEREGKAPGRAAGELPFFRVRDLVLAAALGAAVVTAIGAALVLSEGDDGPIPTEVMATPAGTPTVTQTAPPAPFTAITPDDLAIEALARRSIEVLPQGQWPSLYADFTADYQARCAKEEFDKAGVESSQELGPDLLLLRFKRLENVSLDEAVGAAGADIVGEVEGSFEYVIRGAFQRVDGVWKIAPAANTAGCGAFERVSG